jgi:hypothetical protein
MKHGTGNKAVPAIFCNGIAYKKNFTHDEVTVKYCNIVTTESHNCPIKTVILTVQRQRKTVHKFEIEFWDYYTICKIGNLYIWAVRHFNVWMLWCDEKLCPVLSIYVFWDGELNFPLPAFPVYLSVGFAMSCAVYSKCDTRHCNLPWSPCLSLASVHYSVMHSWVPGCSCVPPAAYPR